MLTLNGDQLIQNGFDGSNRSSRRLNPISRKMVSSKLSSSCRERTCCHQSVRTWFNPPRRMYRARGGEAADAPAQGAPNLLFY